MSTDDTYADGLSNVSVNFQLEMSSIDNHPNRCVNLEYDQGHRTSGEVMHIPPYARNEIEIAVPAELTNDQSRGNCCCFCEGVFSPSYVDRVTIDTNAHTRLGACRTCLTELVAHARRNRETLTVPSADARSNEPGGWTVNCEAYIRKVERLQQAATTVAELAEAADLGVQDLGWLFVYLESGRTWTSDDQPEIPDSMDPRTTPFAKAEFSLVLDLAQTWKALARRFAYHIINEAMDPEPDMCTELDCPSDCSGKHEWEDVDCGPDEIYNVLEKHGYGVPKPAAEPTS